MASRLRYDNAEEKVIILNNLLVREPEGLVVIKKGANHTFTESLESQLFNDV